METHFSNEEMEKLYDEIARVEQMCLELITQQAITQKAITQKEVMTVDDVCEFLGFKKSYIYKLTHLRDIPYYKPEGKVLFFKRSEITDWVLRNRHKTVRELESDAATYGALHKRK